MVDLLNYLVENHLGVVHLFTFCLYFYLFWRFNWIFLHDKRYNFCKVRYIFFDEFDHLFGIFFDDFTSYLSDITFDRKHRLRKNFREYIQKDIIETLSKRELITLIIKNKLR